MDNQQQSSVYRKVMVIDDTELDLMIAQMAMKKYRFTDEVILKKSAMAGLEYLESCSDKPDELPQLIFLDINMPELSGFDFLDRYANLPELVRQHCIIMMLSTSLAEEDHRRATQNRFVAQFLSKPLDKQKLEAIRLGPPTPTGF